MPVVLTDKKLNLAQNFITQSTSLITAYYACKKFYAEYLKGGISYATGDFDNTALKNVDPIDMGNLITRCNDFIAWFEAGTACSGGTATADVLLKVQNGI
jgi:hypothetical protein